MRVSDWLDEQEAAGIDVSRIELPEDLANSEIPDETLFFREKRECSILCPGDHPFATVERFGHWYHSRGRDREAGPHTTKEQWRLFTRDKDFALRTALEHIERN